MPALRNPLFISLIVACAFFMQILDGTVISTALPQMAESFGTSPIYLNVGITAYILTVAVFIPISGWVADRFGTRSVFGTAIGIFTVGSVLCGLSANLEAFTASRVLQGIGGAMMVPVGQLVVLRSAAKHKLVGAMNLVTMPGLVATVVGPPVGGFITTFLSWHWIFFLNVPLGLIGMALVAVFIPNFRSEERRPLDWGGFALTSAALVALMYGLELAGRRHAEWQVAGGLILGGVLIGGLAARHALRQVHPLLDLTAFRFPSFALAIGAGGLFRTTIGAFPYLLPLMFQVAFGLSAFASGMLILSNAVGDVLMKLAIRRTIRQFGFRTILTINGSLAAATILALGMFRPTTPVPLMVTVLFVSGLFRSLQFTSLSTLGYADIPPKMMSTASALASMIQQMSIGCGVALAAIILQVSLMLRGATSEILVTGDFAFAFAVVAIIALVSSLLFLRLDPRAGAEVSGHKAAAAGQPGEAAAGE